MTVVAAFYASRRLESLPQFINDQKTKFNSTVDLLFGQAKGNTNSAGLGLWVNAALSLVKTLPSTAELPVLRFDIEYDAKSSDLERVLKQAAWVRKAVNKAFPSPSRRPLVAWALDFASMLPLQASYAPCPAKGQNNKVMLGGKCFLHIVDHVDLMDFRSYAIQAPQNGPCDGAVRFAVPFFETAAELGKTVSVGFETNCGLGEYTYKISFCGPVQEQKYGTADPLEYVSYPSARAHTHTHTHTHQTSEVGRDTTDAPAPLGLGLILVRVLRRSFMYASMADTVQFLRNTSAGLEAFPCAAEPITGLGALSPNKVRSPVFCAVPVFACVRQAPTASLTSECPFRISRVCCVWLTRTTGTLRLLLSPL